MAVETPTIVQGTDFGNNRMGNRDVRRLKTITLITANTVDATDTLAIDLATVGGSVLLGFLGFKQTTDDSVIVEEAVTSAVSSTTVTFTIPAGTDNDPRIIKVFYR